MKELAISLQGNTKIPLYEQIYNYIKNEIIEGRILQGEKLPSTRFQAQYLEVSRSTVELAYDQLLAEGYISSEPYRGYFVCDVRELYHFTKQHDEQIPKVEQKQPDASLVHTTHKKSIQPPIQIDFSPTGISLEHFPFVPFSKIMKNLLLDHGNEILKSGDARGEVHLRQEICNYLYRSRHVQCENSQIVIGAGNEFLQMMIAQLLGTDHRIAMESPTYLQAYRTFQNSGFSMCEIPLDKDGMQVSQLEASKADIAYVMPSHQFPMGIVMPLKRRLELLSWASDAAGRYIIEDDYDSEFRYKGKPIPSLQGIDRMEKVIYLGTFSNSIAPSMRISYMVLPKSLVSLYEANCGFYSATVPRLMQETIYQFMAEGYFEKNLNRMRGWYKGRHDQILGDLKSCGWVRRILGENSGLHVLVEINTRKEEGELVEICQQAGLRVYGISEYFISRRSTFSYPILMLGYGGLSEIQIQEGIEKLNLILCKTIS